MSKVVRAICDYVASNKDHLSFREGDEIIVLEENDDGRWKGRLKHNNNHIGYFSTDYIHVHFMDINRICFCGKPMKEDYLKRYNTDQLPCQCCHNILKNETIFYQCGTWGRCGYYQMRGLSYGVCSRCFHTVNDDDNKSDKTTSNALKLKKIRVSMKRINEEMMHCSSEDEVQKYIFRIYGDLYVRWIRKLSETEFGKSKAYKMVFEEFNAFYGSILSQCALQLDASQRIVTAKSDYKGMIENELTFEKNDKMIILLDNDDGFMFAKAEKNGEKGMLYIDYINIQNINQICYCNRPLKEGYHKKTECECCCKKYPKKDISFYYCGDPIHCEYYQISTRHYFVCAQCFNTKNDDLENKDDFKMNKVRETIKIINKEMETYKDNQQKRKYIIHVRMYMYTMWIRKLNDEETEHVFRTFYDKHLDLIGKEIDLKELELNEEIMRTINNDESSNIKLNKISLEWRCLMEENQEKEAQFEDICSGDLEQCPVRKRIEFIMDLYKTYFLLKYVYDKKEEKDIEFTQIFTKALTHYDGIELMNDSQHYALYHANDDGLRDCDIEKNEEYNEYICCKSLLKTQRDSHFALNTLDSFSIYCNKIHFKELNIIEITSNLHQMINHEMKPKERENEMESNTVKMRSLKWVKRGNEETYNKFMNEVIEEKENETENKANEKASMDDICDVLIEKGASNEECMVLMNELNENEYDSESIIMDITNENDGYNQHKASNLFICALNKNKYFMKIIKKHFKQNMNDDDKISRFDLGQYQLQYWSHFKDYSTFNTPKYRSLKEETLNNNIHRIALNTFNRFLNKAFLSAHSFKGRALKAQDRSGTNDDYAIPADLRVTVGHVLVIIFYCNLNELQRLYKKKGCRELNVGEGLDALKTRNKEIGHWYRLLKEVIYFYGSKATTNSVYYTGINVSVCFDSFVARFKCPISTTTQWHIAHNFSKGVGVILKMVPAPNCMDRCFNVEWLSDYKSESERLFFSANNLQIIDIQYFDACEVCKNPTFVSAFRVWSSLFSGAFFHIHLRGERRERTQKTLIKLIRNYGENNGINNTDNAHNIGIHIYIQQMFYHLLQQMNEEQIYMIPSEFDLLNDSLKEELLSFECTSSDMNDNPQKISLSPFLSSLINSSDIRILTEYIWILSEKQIHDLKYGQKDKWIMTEEEYHYQLKNNENVSFKMGIGNNSDNDYTVFRLEITKSSLKSMRGVFSIAINDLNWTLNRWPVNDVSEDQSVNPFLFEDKLLKETQSLILRIAILFRR